MRHYGDDEAWIKSSRATWNDDDTCRAFRTATAGSFESLLMGVVDEDYLSSSAFLENLKKGAAAYWRSKQYAHTFDTSAVISSLNCEIMTFARSCLVITSVSLLTGCGAIMHGSRQDVMVQSSVPGATVQTSPLSTSVTAPGTISLERKNNYVLTFSAPGYTSANVSVQNSIGIGTVIADVLLTGLVGVVVDGLTGSWYGLNPETANATLIKQTGTIGPDEIHIQLGRMTGDGKLTPRADAAGVGVEVTRK